MNFVTEAPHSLLNDDYDDYEGMSDYDEPKLLPAASEPVPKKKLHVKRYRFKADEPCKCEKKRANAKARARTATGKFVKDSIVWKPASSFW